MSADNRRKSDNDVINQHEIIILKAIRLPRPTPYRLSVEIRLRRLPTIYVGGKPDFPTRNVCKIKNANVKKYEASVATCWGKQTAFQRVVDNPYGRGK